MNDELKLLHECVELMELLTYYGQLGEADREAWQPRLMELDSVEPKELSRLHGELIASGWIELTIARSRESSSTGPSGCYRITPEGRRALRGWGAARNTFCDSAPDDRPAESGPTRKRRAKATAQVLEVAEVARIEPILERMAELA